MDVVKSVGRVFEVLELFDREQVALSAIDVEKKLGYPQSSTLALLKSLAKLNYLSFDQIERTYFPTMRVLLLGQWLNQSSERLESLVNEISELTGETVSLSCQNDIQMQFLSIKAGTKRLTLNVQEGEKAPLFHSNIGLTALAQKDDKEIRKLAARVNKRMGDDQAEIDIDAVLNRIKVIQKQGYSVGYDNYMHSVGSIAWAIPTGADGRVMILSVAGHCDAIKAEETNIISTVTQLLERE